MYVLGPSDHVYDKLIQHWNNFRNKKQKHIILGKNRLFLKWNLVWLSNSFSVSWTKSLYSKEQLKFSAATHFPSGHWQWSIRLSGVEDRIFLVCLDLNAKKLGKKSELVKREKSCLSVRYLMFFWSYMLHKSLYIWWTRQWNNNIPKTVSPTVLSWEKNYWTLIFMPF